MTNIEWEAPDPTIITKDLLMLGDLQTQNKV